MHLLQHHKSIVRVFLLLVNGFCLTNYEKYTTVFLFQFCFYTVKKVNNFPIPSRLGTGKSVNLFLQCMLLTTCPSTRLLPFLCSSIRNRLSMIWLLTVRITSSGCACERFTLKHFVLKVRLWTIHPLTFRPQGALVNDSPLNISSSGCAYERSILKHFVLRVRL